MEFLPPTVRRVAQIIWASAKRKGKLHHSFDCTLTLSTYYTVDAHQRFDCRRTSRWLRGHTAHDKSAEGNRSPHNPERYRANYWFRGKSSRLSSLMPGLRK